jgi:hypothetical protein
MFWTHACAFDVLWALIGSFMTRRNDGAEQEFCRRLSNDIVKDRSVLEGTSMSGIRRLAKLDRCLVS